MQNNNILFRIIRDFFYQMHANSRKYLWFILTYLDYRDKAIKKNPERYFREN